MRFPSQIVIIMESDSPRGQMDLIETKDGKTYKIERQLFCQYSPFYSTMIQDTEQEVFYLPTIHSAHFDFIYEFMQLHKKEKPRPVASLYPGVKLTAVMEEADAELVGRIFAGPPEEVKAVVDAAFLLHVDELLKRLTAGLMGSLKREETKQLVEASKKSKLINEQEVSTEIHKKIEMIFESKLENAHEPIEAEEQS